MRPGAAGLVLVEKAVVGGALVAGSSQIDTLLLVQPGKPDESYLVMKVKGTKGIRGKRMPPRGDGLTAGEMAFIEAWILALGAPEAEEAEPAPEEEPAARDDGGKPRPEGRSDPDGVKGEQGPSTGGDE